MFRSPIKRRPDGSYRFAISADERRLVASVVGQLRDLLLADDPSLVRLFPPLYGDDDERNAGYAALAGSELVDRRLGSIDVVLDTIEADSLTQDELESWMRSINDVRLALGTILDVDESERPSADPDETASANLAVYQYLGALLEMTVRALSR